MCQILGRSLVFAAAVVGLVGCAGRLTEPLTFEAREAEPVQHPLSYLPIQQVAHSKKAEVVDVGFSQRYDVYCVLIPDSSTVYRNCQILGTTFREDLKKSVDLSSSSWKGNWEVAELFDNMLVLETEDGRLAYIPHGSVRYIEEASPTRPQQAPRELPPRELPLSGL
jgi:hypothetical protein